MFFGNWLPQSYAAALHLLCTDFLPESSGTSEYTLAHCQPELRPYQKSLPFVSYNLLHPFFLLNVKIPSFYHTFSYFSMLVRIISGVTPQDKFSSARRHFCLSSPALGRMFPKVLSPASVKRAINAVLFSCQTRMALLKDICPPPKSPLLLPVVERLAVNGTIQQESF